MVGYILWSSQPTVQSASNLHQGKSTTVTGLITISGPVPDSPWGYWGGTWVVLPDLESM